MALPEIHQSSKLLNTAKKSQVWFGSVLALFSAATFAMNMVLAGMSYQFGANIHSLNLARAFVFFLLLLTVIVVTKTSFHLPVRARLMCGVVGILLCTEMYVLLGAIQTIPVALAVLIFYTYPILIACWRWLRGADEFSLPALGLLVVAFLGLVFVLINGPVEPHHRGVALSVVAATVMAAMLITSEHSLKNYNNQVVLAHALGVVVFIISVLTLSVVKLQWPVGDMGWWIFSGSTLFYVLATFSLFKAVSLVGPLRTAILDNTAPVWAMVFGFFLLHQVMSSRQIGGALLVIAAVMVLQLMSRHNVE